VPKLQRKRKKKTNFADEVKGVQGAARASTAAAEGRIEVLVCVHELADVGSVVTDDVPHLISKNHQQMSREAKRKRRNFFDNLNQGKIALPCWIACSGSQ
jgi:hypothetical protein